MNNQQMMRVASLQHRVARIEKEAALRRIKEKIKAMLSSFGKSTEQALLYMPEKDIKKAVVELKRNPKFMEGIKKLPPRTPFQKVKEFLAHYFRKEMRLTNTNLRIAVVVGAIAYLFPAWGIGLIGLALFNAILDDPGRERERTQERAQYHARNRILNERKASRQDPDYQWVNESPNICNLKHRRLGIVGSVEKQGGKWFVYDERGEVPITSGHTLNRGKEALLDHLDVSDLDVHAERTAGLPLVSKVPPQLLKATTGAVRLIGDSYYWDQP